MAQKLIFYNFCRTTLIVFILTALTIRPKSANITFTPRKFNKWEKLSTFRTLFLSIRYFGSYIRKRAMLFLTKYCKILYSIIKLISIHMVYHFFRKCFEFSSKVIFHYNPMFSDLSSINTNKFIAISNSTATIWSFDKLRLTISLKKGIVISTESPFSPLFVVSRFITANYFASLWKGKYLSLIPACYCHSLIIPHERNL